MTFVACLLLGLNEKIEYLNQDTQAYREQIITLINDRKEKDTEIIKAQGHVDRRKLDVQGHQLTLTARRAARKIVENK